MRCLLIRSAPLKGTRRTKVHQNGIATGTVLGAELGREFADPYALDPPPVGEYAAAMNAAATRLLVRKSLERLW